MIKDSKIPTKANALIITYGCTQIALKALLLVCSVFCTVSDYLIKETQFNLNR